MEQFEHARRGIADALAGLAVTIEHVSSTAVPGLGSRKRIGIATREVLAERFRGCHISASIPSVRGTGHGYSYMEGAAHPRSAIVEPLRG